MIRYIFYVVLSIPILILAFIQLTDVDTTAHDSVTNNKGKYTITTNKGVVYKTDNMYIVNDCVIFSVAHIADPMKICSDYKVERK